MIIRDHIYSVKWYKVRISLNNNFKKQKKSSQSKPSCDNNFDQSPEILLLRSLLSSEPKDFADWSESLKIISCLRNIYRIMQRSGDTFPVINIGKQESFPWTISIFRTQQGERRAAVSDWKLFQLFKTISLISKLFQTSQPGGPGLWSHCFRKL